MTLGRRGFLNGLLATCGLPGTARPDMPRRTLRADVFVAGAGPAGFVAAIAAARRGAKVTLAEGAPDWVKGVSVNADGEIVLDVKPKGTMIIVR